MGILDNLIRTPKSEEIRGVLDDIHEQQVNEDPEIVVKSRASQLKESVSIPISRGAQLKKDFQRSAMRDFSLSFNRSIAKGLDLPGDAMAGLVELLVNDVTFGVDKNLGQDKFNLDIPSGGFLQFYEETGATVPEDQIADNLPSEIGTFLGEQALFTKALSFAKNLKPGNTNTFFGKAKESLRGFGRSTTATSRGFKKRFGKNTLSPSFVTGETLAGTAAATGGFIVEEKFPDSPVGKFFGQVGGGLVTQALPANLLIRGGQLISRKIKEPFLPERAQQRAKKRLQRDVGDPQVAAENLRNPGVSKEFEDAATNAQLTQDTQILRIEKSIIKHGDNQTSADQLAAGSDEQIANLNNIVIKSIENQTGNVELTTKSLQRQQQYLQTLIDRRFQQVQSAAKKEIEGMGVLVTEQEATLVVKKNLDNLVNDLDVTEKQLWDAVDMDGPANGGTVIQQWRQLLARQTDELAPSDLHLKDESGAKDLFMLLGGPDKKGKFVPGKWAKKKLTLQNLQDLRSRILQSIRTLRKEGGSARRIANLEKMENSILQEMGAVSSHVDTVNGQSLRIALDFTRNKNQTLRSGVVGDILAVDKQGQSRIPDALILEKALVGKGEKANENLKQILKPFDFAKKSKAEAKAKFVEDRAFEEGIPDQLTASERQGLEAEFELANPPTPDETELIGAMDDFITSKFLDAHTIDGHVKVGPAKNFLIQNKELLERFPQTKAKIEKAIDAQNTFEIVSKQTDNAAKRLSNPSISIAALWIQKGHVATYDSILSSNGALTNQKVASLIAKLKKDKSGRAMEGAQAGFFDWLRSRATVAESSKNISSQTIFGDKFLSSTEFTRLMNKPQVKKLAARLLTKEQQDRIGILGKEMRIIDLARSAQASKEPLVIDTPGRIRSVLARVLGARTGTKVAQATGTGGIQMQAIFSKESLDLLNKRFEDPAGKLLHDAIMGGDRRLLEVLLKPVIDKKSLIFVRSHLSAWLTTALYEQGERSASEVKEMVLDIGDSLNGVIDISERLE